MILPFFQLALVLGCGIAPAVRADDETTPASAPNLLERIAVFGASVSSGYGLDAELKTPVRLGDVIECLIDGDSKIVTDLGDLLFFTDAPGKGAPMARRAQEADPTLVIALDFLIWYAYGDRLLGEERLAGLERGFAELARFDCPIVVWDFPDLAHALSGSGPFGLPLILPEMLPQPEIREKLNARLYEWAKQRGNVIIVPLGSFLQKLFGNESFEVHGNEWPAGAQDRIMQKDYLHPTVEGTLAVVILTFDRLVKARPEVDVQRFTWDVAAARKRLMEATAKARERFLDGERRRAERTRKRKERARERASRED